MAEPKTESFDIVPKPFKKLDFANKPDMGIRVAQNYLETVDARLKKYGEKLTLQDEIALRLIAQYRAAVVLSSVQLDVSMEYLSNLSQLHGVNSSGEKQQFDSLESLFDDARFQARFDRRLSTMDDLDVEQESSKDRKYELSRDLLNEMLRNNPKIGRYIDSHEFWAADIFSTIDSLGYTDDVLMSKLLHSCAYEYVVNNGARSRRNENKEKLTTNMTQIAGMVLDRSIGEDARRALLRENPLKQVIK
jgi:hypothetical protein